MVDQAAVHAPVSILERVYIDKTEGGRRRLQHRVNAVFAHAAVCFEHAAHEVVQILWPGADKLRQRVAVLVSFA